MTTEIRYRTQGESENIIIYMAVMQAMISRLSTPMSEKDQLEILLHNIRPCYTNVLANCTNVDSINRLKSICRNYEQVKARSDNFKEPIIAISSKTLAPEFAYQTANKNLPKNYSSDRSYANRLFANINKIFAMEKSKFCYRCRVDTHNMKECSAERVIFCFKCGIKDVRSTECPECNKTKIETNHKN
ncbi:unnamed protein product [Parnassius mnemosyne]|uniref:Uncharacterized protein n=1 Tax=Parnassius mnemosyne TaxID=213953 RepID=A0AAV1LM34_9NEOP